MFKNIIIGLKAYQGVFTLIPKLGLWKYFLVPIVISIVTAVSVGFLAWGFSDTIGVFISKIWVWEWGKETFTSIGTVLGALLIMVIGLLLYKNIILALSAPFMGPVSEKIEAAMTGLEKIESNASFASLLWRGIIVNSRNLFMELLFSIPILFVSFIPIIGFLTTPLLFLVQSYYAGFGVMDYTLERHYNHKDSIAFVRTQSGKAIGLGSIFMLLLLIPVVGIILVLPLSVVAASKVTLDAIPLKKTIYEN